MRPKQQTDGAIQQDQPSDNMHKLTQKTSDILKEARHSDNGLRGLGKPLDEC